MPLLSYRSWRFTRFDRRAVHLESFQLTALEAAFVYDATVVQAPRVGAVACRLACGADKNKTVHNDPDSNTMRSSDGQVVVQIPRLSFLFHAECNTETSKVLDGNCTVHSDRSVHELFSGPAGTPGHLDQSIENHYWNGYQRQIEMIKVSARMARYQERNQIHDSFLAGNLITRFLNCMFLCECFF